jgi:hypothetical protein
MSERASLGPGARRAPRHGGSGTDACVVGRAQRPRRSVWRLPGGMSSPDGGAAVRRAWCPAVRDGTRCRGAAPKHGQRAPPARPGFTRVVTRNDRVVRVTCTSPRCPCQGDSTPRAPARPPVSGHQRGGRGRPGGFLGGRSSPRAHRVVEPGTTARSVRVSESLEMVCAPRRHGAAAGRTSLALEPRNASSLTASADRATPRLVTRRAHAAACGVAASVAPSDAPRGVGPSPHGTPV